MKITEKIVSILVPLCVIFAISINACAAAGLALEDYNGSFFTLKKPRSWQIVTGGTCSTFAFILQDPAMPLRQVFYFSEIGQVYTSQQRKAFDYQYMAGGGYPVAWIEMPVVDPLTPSNFLRSFEEIAHTRLAKQFIPNFPELQNLQIISAMPQAGFIAGRTELIRALFTREGQVGEGLFLVTVARPISVPGVPGGTTSGMNIVGISAPKNEFPQMEQLLESILASFKISPTYVRNCINQQAAAFGAVSDNGHTVRGAADIVAEGWNKRSRAEDIMAEKTKDAFRDITRLYDPETKEVYEFPSDFVEQYDRNRNRYQLNDLQRLPDNSDLWNKATRDGLGNLH